jgi:hypothetical protein
MSDLAEQESLIPPLLRDRSGMQRVTAALVTAALVTAALVTAALVTAVAVSDRLPWLPHPAEPAPRASPGEPARPGARS